MCLLAINIPAKNNSKKYLVEDFLFFLLVLLNHSIMNRVYPGCHQAIALSHRTQLIAHLTGDNNKKK